jgi:hypothetical protein
LRPRQGVWKGRNRLQVPAASGDDGKGGHRPLFITKKGDRRTKPLRPPVRPLHRLIIGAQHTIKYLETHPTAWLWWAGRSQGRKTELEETGFRRLPLQG